MRFRTRLVVACVALVALLLAGVGVGYAITNGQPDNGAHPYVGLLVFDVDGVPAWRCSGTLLSPTVVLTAGHCTEGADAARLWLDEIVTGNPEYPYGGHTSYEGIAYTYPDFCVGCGGGIGGAVYRDVGIVVLKERVRTKDISGFGALPTAGLVDELVNKTPVTLVGYGVQQQISGGGPPTWTGLRNRLTAPSELVAGDFEWSNEFVRLSMNPGGGTGGVCFGDSGGPDLLGDTNVVLSVNSYVTNSNCSGVGYSSRVDIPEVLEWIEGFLDD